MGNIMTRAAIIKIMADENMTPEQRTEQVMSLYGRALDDGYISKTAAQTAQQTAIENAKAEWEKGYQKPDPKESEEYKALQSQYEEFRTMTTARTSEDYKDVKPKFFETVYSMIDRKEGAKPVPEQLTGIREKFEEYFNPQSQEQQPAKKTPQFSQTPGHSGVNPNSEEDKLYKQLADSWK